MAFFEEPGQWSFPFFNEEASQFKWQELLRHRGS